MNDTNTRAPHDRPCKNPNSRLARVTRTLLMNTAIPMARIAVDCELSYPWLMRYKSHYGEREMPSVDKIERLYEYLSGKRLEL